jgi:hypothetical protein
MLLRSSHFIALRWKHRYNCEHNRFCVLAHQPGTTCCATCRKRCQAVVSCEHSEDRSCPRTYLMAHPCESTPFLRRVCACV